MCLPSDASKCYTENRSESLTGLIQLWFWLKSLSQVERSYRARGA